MSLFRQETFWHFGIIKTYVLFGPADIPENGNFVLMDLSVQRKGTLKFQACYGRGHFGAGTLWKLELLAEMWMAMDGRFQCYNFLVPKCPHRQNVSMH